MAYSLISRVTPHARRTQLSISHSFSTESGSAISEERARKLKALFGVTTATDGLKPLGMPIKPTTPAAGTAGAAGNTDKGAVIAGKEGEESAEKAWLDSGYIEYMNNQKDKGWKS